MGLVDHAELLTSDQIDALTKRYHETHDRKIEAQLVRAHLRLVAKLARERSRDGRNFSDLYQEGCVGLVEGIRRFDPSRGVKLSSYASWWIRARQYRYLISNQRIVRLGTTEAQRKIFFNLRKLRARMARGDGEPSMEALAHALGVDEREVSETAARLDRRDASLDAPRRAKPSLAETLAADDDPEGASARDELRTLVHQRAVAFRDLLDARDRAIFDARCLRDEPESLSDLGRRLGVTRERVRQLEARILDRLEPKLAALAA